MCVAGAESVSLDGIAGTALSGAAERGACESREGMAGMLRTGARSNDSLGISVQF